MGSLSLEISWFKVLYLLSETNYDGKIETKGISSLQNRGSSNDMKIEVVFRRILCLLIQNGVTINPCSKKLTFKLQLLIML